MTISRRRFFYTTLGASGVLVLGCAGGSLLSASKAPDGDAGVWRSPYLRVTPDGRYILIFDKAEMGQGVITGQATLFGEEADISPTRFETESAPVADVYGTLGPAQVTGGSTSTVDRWLVLRQAGAAYRQAVLKAAASHWGVAAASLSTDDAFVIHPKTSERLSYASLNGRIGSIEMDESPPLKADSQFKYIGKFSATLGAEDKATGRALYGIDFDMEGLRVAVIVRPPVFGATLAGIDEVALRKLPYVRDVKRLASGVALVCDRFWQCLQARQAVTDAMVRWTTAPEQRIDTPKLFEQYAAKLDPSPVAEPGAKVVSATFRLPFLTHAPLEPQNCAAWRQKDRFQVWAPTQSPTHIRNVAADVSGLSRDRVEVHTSKYLGGGFGRRGANDFAVETIELANQVDYPVKVMWTREDDMQSSPMRPMAVHQIDATMADGKVKGWRHQIVCQAIASDILPPFVGAVLPVWMPKFVRSRVASSLDGIANAFDVMFMEREGAEPTYDVPSEIIAHQQTLDVPTLYWRSVGHSINGFVLESFVDILAAELGKDPVALRLDLLHKSPEARRVVELARDMAGWPTAKPLGNRALGFAYHKSFGTHAAQVADVEVDGTTIKVHRVFCAVDCGTVVNPGIVAAQVRSAVVFGLTAALYGKITLKDGIVEQTNFDTYRLLSATESPEIIVRTVDSTAKPSGIGEPGVPPLAAAVGNAIFKITGRRLTSLPFDLGSG